MSLVEILKQADSCLRVQNYNTAKECFEKALAFSIDEQIKSVVYENLSICCNYLKDTEGEMLYLELLVSNEDYEGIYDASVSLAKLYRDTGRLADMYRIGKKISALPHPTNSIKQPEQLYYELWCRQNEPNTVELERQKSYMFEHEPKISIVVPVYNVKIEYLVEMLNSVCVQTYANWELCLADGNSSNEEIRETIRRYAERDSRIRYVFLDKNLGISENTNAAIEMSNGKYIAFLDHDDILPENALFEVCVALEYDNELELIYTDHDIITRYNGENIKTAPFFKPDWSPVLYEQINYILHLVVLKREILTKIGLLRKEYDRAQDTELLLRITENTDKIFHIPKILYHWRMHTESTNFSQNGTPIDIVNKVLSAKAEHLTRINVLYKESDFKTLEIVIRDNPLVSLIIVNKDSYSYLKKCIEAIQRTAGYMNYEIIIVDNGSIENDVLLYYKALEQKKIAIVITQNSYDSTGYAADYNYGAKKANGKYLVFISAQSELKVAGWLYAFLQTQQYPRVGLTGCKVIFTNEEHGVTYSSGIQFTGSNRTIGHTRYSSGEELISYPEVLKLGEVMSRAELEGCNNATALDSGCIMIEKQLFERLGGFDTRFPFTFYIFDLCLKSRTSGYYNIWINAIELDCMQNKGIYNQATQENFDTELEVFEAVYKNELEKEDPFININFSALNYIKNGCLLNIRDEVKI